MSSTGGNAADSDDDLIICHVCLNFYNEGDRLPKFLDCHHSFCLSCIKDFRRSGSTLSCPSCRIKTNLARKKLEDLRTNQYALRLIVSTNNQAKIAAELKQIKVLTAKSRIWCKECSSIGTESCVQNSHVTCQFEPYFKEMSSALAQRVEKCSSTWDQIVACRKEVRDKYQHLASYLCYLLSKVESKISVHDTFINQIMSFQEEVLDLPEIADQDLDDENLTFLMNQLNGMASRLDWMEDEADLVTPQRELNALSVVEGMCIHVELENDQPSTKPVRQISALQKQSLSLSATGLPHPVNACVSVLTYLMMILTEEDAKSAGVESSTTLASRLPKGREAIDLRIQLPSDSPPGGMSQTEKNRSIDRGMMLSSDGLGSFQVAIESTELVNSHEPSMFEIAVSRLRNSNSPFKSSASSTTDDLTPGSVRLPWKCQICAKEFRMVQSYRQHLNSHSTARPYECEPCGLTYKRRGDYEKHLRRHSDAQEVATSPLRPRRSLPTVNYNATSVPAASDDKEQPPAPSVVIETENDDSPFKCPTCDKVFTYKQSLNQHMYSHSTSRPFDCRICGKAFKRNGDLVKHMRTHPKASFYRSTAFKRSTQLYKRSIANATLVAKSKIRSASKAQKEPAPSLNEDSRRKWKCDMCEKGFEFQSYLKRHVLTAHSSFKPFTCPHCNQAFKLKLQLNRHMNTNCTGPNNRDLHCKTCDKTFKFQKVYQRHMRGHRQPKIPYSCDTCGQTFNKKDEYSDHLANHSTSRPFRCSICQKGFNWKQDLMRHVQTHSEDGRNFKCSKCNKDFVRIDRCKKHEMICSVAEEGT